MNFYYKFKINIVLLFNKDNYKNRDWIGLVGKIRNIQNK